MSPPEDRKAALKAEAKSLGFDCFGIAAPIAREPHAEYFLDWLKSGAHGQMQWLERSNERRLSPSHILPETRSVICVGLNYFNRHMPETKGAFFSRYAAGRDYHRVVLKKLKRLCALLRSWGADNKPYVDTGPVFEKAFAARAGIGWQGRNSLLINETFGPWLFLGVIFTTLELPIDKPVANHCGKCRRCADACPTGALDGKGGLDARKCLAYLTIEHKGPLPEWAQRLMGGCLLGCDRCAQACPWGRQNIGTRESAFAAAPPPDPREVLFWDLPQWRERFSGTAIMRPGLEGLQRNALAVIGNTGIDGDIDLLDKFCALTHNNALKQAACEAILRIRHRSPQSPHE